MIEKISERNDAQYAYIKLLEFLKIKNASQNIKM